MVNESFTKKEIAFLKEHGYDVKNNLQDAYKTYKSPSLIDYKVHISLSDGKKYFVKEVGADPIQELIPLGFTSIEQLIDSLDHRFTEVNL